MFAKSFLKHPLLLGVPVESSPALVERTLSKVDWARARTVVEHGPGAGTMTGEILRRLPPDGTLVAVERNPDFVGYLQERLDDPRLHVVHASAEETPAILDRLKLPPADAVVSGIPFSPIPPEARQAIVRAMRESLAPGGTIVVYNFFRVAGKVMERELGPVEEELEPRGVLPMRVFSWRE